MLRDLTAVINAECAADDAEYDCCRDPDHHTEEPAHVAEDRRANKSKESSHSIQTNRTSGHNQRGVASGLVRLSPETALNCGQTGVPRVVPPPTGQRARLRKSLRT